MTTLRSLAPLLISAAFAGACVDLSPLSYDGAVPTFQDVNIPDVAYEVGSADGATDPCTQCLRTKCDGLTACEKNAKCAKFSVCMTATNCWGSSLTDVSNLAPCVISCGASSGLLSQTDPAAALITPVFTCTNDPTVCGGICLAAADASAPDAASVASDP